MMFYYCKCGNELNYGDKFCDNCKCEKPFAMEENDEVRR